MREDLVPYAYEVQTAGNPRAMDTETCVAACRSVYGEEGSGFFGCLGTCPGVRIVEGAECTPDATRQSVCYTDLVREMVPDEEATMDFFEALGAIAEIAASASHHGEHHHGEHHHAEHHHAEHHHARR